MFIRRLARSYMTSLPVIKMGFGKLPMVSRFRAYPLREMMMGPLNNPQWKQLAVTPQTIPKKNKHTDKADRPEFGYRRRSEQPTYDVNQEKFVDRREAEGATDDHQHSYTQKTHWRNLKEKIRQKAPLWQPQHHLKKGDSTSEDRSMKRKVAEVYLKKDAESFPLQKSKPFPKD